MLLFAYLNGYSEGASLETISDASCSMESGLPDLVVTDTYVGYGQRCGKNTRIESTVRNNGTATSQSSRVGYFLSTNTTWDANDLYLSNDYVHTLIVGNEADVWNHGYILAPQGPGIYYILYVADYENVITESNENNNVTYREINIHTCPPLPDLVVENNTINKTTTTCGSWVRVTATVKNKDYTSTGTWSSLGYYLSTDIYNFDPDEDILLASDYVPTLAPLATSYEWQWLWIPSNTPSGKYAIYFVADYQGRVNERHTYNNDDRKKYITVTCGPAERQSTGEGMNVNNFPSPFSESTAIEFDLPEDGPVTLFVSDMTGKRVAVLLDNEQQYAGINQVIFDGSNYPAGTYCYTIQAGEYTATKKMVLMR